MLRCPTTKTRTGTMPDRCTDPTCAEHWPMGRTDCPHDSWVGVDTTPISDPGKVWRCTECGLTR
jgi:hypothetical protein